MPWRDGSTYAYCDIDPDSAAPISTCLRCPLLCREYFPPSHPSNRVSTHLVAAPLRIATCACRPVFVLSCNILARAAASPWSSWVRYSDQSDTPRAHNLHADPSQHPSTPIGRTTVRGRAKASCLLQKLCSVILTVPRGDNIYWLPPPSQK